MRDLTALSPSAAPRPTAYIFDAEIRDDATAEDQEVRCIRPRVDRRAATDPMPWTPVSRPSGWFFPKRGDRAVLGYPVDGPPVILSWWPAGGASPDVPA